MKRAYCTSQYAKPCEQYCRETYPDEAASILQKAEEYYLVFLKDMPDLGKNMMAKNMLDWFTILAFYEASGHRMDGETLLTIKRKKCFPILCFDAINEIQRHFFVLRYTVDKILGKGGKTFLTMAILPPLHIKTLNFRYDNTILVHEVNKRYRVRKAFRLFRIAYLFFFFLLRLFFISFIQRRCCKELFQILFHLIQIGIKIVFQPVGDFTWRFSIKLHEGLCRTWQDITGSGNDVLLYRFAFIRKKRILI